MGQITGGELILRCLAQEDIKTIFAVPDAGYNPVLGKLKDYGVRLVPPRHEAAAAHMADAMTRMTGRPAVCMSGAGPGTANLVSGIATAYAEGSPVVAITCNRRRPVIYPDRGGSFQYCNQVDLFKPVTKWNAVVNDWARIPELVQKAFRTATSCKPGPVQLDVPDDIFYATGDEDSVRVVSPKRYRVGYRLAANPELVEEAAQLLTKAKLPLLHAGGGVKHSKAAAVVCELAEYLGAVVSTSAGARGVVAEDHPQCFHCLSPAVREARKNADVVVVIGSQFGETEFRGQAPDWGKPEAQRVIQIDIDPERIGVSREVDIAIIGDARRVVADILERVRQLGPRRGPGARVESFRATQDLWIKELLSTAGDSPDSPVHPGAMAATVRRFFPRDSIMVLDGGNNGLYTAHYHHIFEPDCMLWTSKFGHLGTGIPYALGAKLACPDKLVYVVTGDSASGFNLMELETAKRENLPIVVIINCDYQWGMEAPGQIMEFGGPEFMVGVAHYPIRYDKIADAMDCHGEYVDNIADLEPALERAVASAKPSVIHVVTNKEANTWPPGLLEFARVYSGEQAAE
ncbi:MAG: thiamine pyrophosphate-binding protein [Candidatus Abyssobacteria bacterium SURF_5]|uniref:Thiamine pyrophosphate-binding protein n=1 Tax=Abyssobacteria bacterium (strain SURF_5) TaxID=2093360 RepID=A0A3A4NFS6_ABYX5|nr:MAG: thiamine pyrophosphate-binding protein [Candidatus Abyssubacteria bacterium SURF_5]